MLGFAALVRAAGDARPAVAMSACALSAMKDRPLPAPPPTPTSVTAAAFGALARCGEAQAFWILFATFFICGASTNGLIQTHFIPMCVDFGMSQTKAAGLLAAIGMFDFVGTIASGWLADRYDNRWLLFWYYGLRGLSLVFLPFTDFTFFGLSMFAVFYGLDWIATVPPTVRLTAQRFGAERANLVFGWIFAGHQIGAAVAAFAAGLSRTMLRDLSAGLLRRRRALHRRGCDRADDLAAGAKAGCRDGCGLITAASSCSPADPACAAARQGARIRTAASASCGGRSPPRPRTFRPSGTASAAC